MAKIRHDVTFIAKSANSDMLGERRRKHESNANLKINPTPPSQRTKFQPYAFHMFQTAPK
ncbi:MAG: hypothetical protein FJW26_04255 [Acidimicrobiia bacterium]|nr:hypothetical protein [Acidimicrobiia bacterium]